MASRPNLLLFMPDQLRADSVGAFGNPVVQTPHVDALARRGTLFSHAWSQHSVCSPSRVSMFTGWYPHVTGHRTLTHLLKPWEPNLLRLLKDAGYNVAWVGQRGDTFSPGLTAESTDFHGWIVRPKFVYGRSPFEREHRLSRAFYHGRRPGEDSPQLDFDEAVTQTAEAWLAAGPREPWLLLVALIFPHPPFEVEEPWYSLHARGDVPAPVDADLSRKPAFVRAVRERYGTDRLDGDEWAELVATYYGMVARVDDQLGRVLDAVAATGAAERTVTAFFTDHGEYLGDYGLVEKWPSGLDDCLLRNPLVVAGPGVREGARCDALVELVDLLPTLLELGGTEARHTHFGRSLVPLLHDPRAAHREAAYSEGGFTRDERHLLEDPPYPYDLKGAVQQADPVNCGKAVAVRTDAWTYVHRLYEGHELYDRSKDPRELVNRAGDPELAAVERELRERVLDWLLATSDVVPWDADPRFDPGPRHRTWRREEPAER